MTKEQLRFVLIIALGVLLLTVGTPRATADTFTSVLNFPNDTLSGFPGPFGTVLVTLDSSTTATIKFTADPGFLFTDGSSAAANGMFLLTPGSITGDCSSCTYSSGGTGNVDGTGMMTAIIDAPNSSPTSRSSTISFNVTADNGTTWSSASNVLVTNANGFDAAAHIFVNSGPSMGITGFAGEGAPVVPEPASILMLGGALLLVGNRLRKRLA